MLSGATKEKVFQHSNLNPQEHAQLARVIKMAQATVAGDIDQMNALGLAYLTGDCGGIDKVVALELIQASAQGGSILGKFNLGRCFYKGNGVIKDETRGKILIEAALGDAKIKASKSYDRHDAEYILDWMKVVDYVFLRQQPSECISNSSSSASSTPSSSASSSSSSSSSSVSLPYAEMTDDEGAAAAFSPAPIIISSGPPKVHKKKENKQCESNYSAIKRERNSRFHPYG